MAFDPQLLQEAAPAQRPFGTGAAPGDCGIPYQIRGMKKLGRAPADYA